MTSVRSFFVSFSVAGLCCLLSPAISPQAAAGESNTGVADDVKPSADTQLPETAIKAAIQKAIEPLQQGATVSAGERKCFTCHNQAMPVLALTRAAAKGFLIDSAVLDRQARHTWDHLQQGKAGYESGTGQGGQVMTAGYALWALEDIGWKPDDVTAAVVHYLTEYQKDEHHWKPSSERMPSMGSHFTSTYLALRALSHFGTESGKEQIEIRRASAARWIEETVAADTESLVFRFRSLPYINASEETVRKSVTELLSQQHADGGWSQTTAMSSDAYATATVLAALLESSATGAGEIGASHPAIVSGCRYLVESQLDDGTWHVITHAKPIQTYYESGFPHGKDQFISISATAWATIALTEALSSENQVPAADLPGSATQDHSQTTVNPEATHSTVQD